MMYPQLIVEFAYVYLDRLDDVSRFISCMGIMARKFMLDGSDGSIELRV